jgi:hypothetical protein
MAKDNRILVNNARVPFSCENTRFATNLEKGNLHKPKAQTAGNVLENPLLEDDQASLWLEHVIDKNTYDELYWLMWYNSEGFPIMPMSSVFDKDDLKKMVSNLIKFVP